MALEDEEIPDPSSLHLAIGEATQAYARTEIAQATVLEGILKVDFQRAHAIFFAVQSAHARMELIETLLDLEFKGALQTFWKSCSSYLRELAKFRNAVVHWHPAVNVYVSHDETQAAWKHSLLH